MSTETIAPSSEGQAGTTPATQVEKPGEQSSVSSQPEGQAPVEAQGEQKQPSQPDARGDGLQPSDYARRRRQQEQLRQKQLYETVNSLSKKFDDLLARQSNTQSAPGSGGIDLPKSILDDPDKTYSALVQTINSLNKKIADIENGVKSVPDLLKRSREEERYSMADQEASQMIAKAGFDEDEVADFIFEQGLDTAYQKNPKKIAEIAIQLMKKEKPANPNVPTKAQMASTASGTPSQAATPSLESLRKTYQDKTIQEANEPHLRRDPRFQEEMKAMKEKILQLQSQQK